MRSQSQRILKMFFVTVFCFFEDSHFFLVILRLIVFDAISSDVDCEYRHIKEY